MLSHSYVTLVYLKWCHLLLSGEDRCTNHVASSCGEEATVLFAKPDGQKRSPTTASEVEDVEVSFYDASYTTTYVEETGTQTKV
jgi:hypothetical protein